LIVVITLFLLETTIVYPSAIAIEFEEIQVDVVETSLLLRQSITNPSITISPWL
jgi:hypothetical protein